MPRDGRGVLVAAGTWLTIAPWPRRAPPGAQGRDLSASIGLVATGCVRRVLVVGLADPLGAIAHVRTAALRAGVVVEPLDGASPTTAVLVRPGPSVVG